MKKTACNIFWFRRDLRLNDNAGLNAALAEGRVLPVFIVDTEILSRLERPHDRRVDFIRQAILSLNVRLAECRRALHVMHCTPAEAFHRLLAEFEVHAVYANEDYEPYSRQRDNQVSLLLASAGVKLHLFKDQCIFHKSEILKPDGAPYTVFTPYFRRWMEALVQFPPKPHTARYSAESFVHVDPSLPSLQALGFEKTSVQFAIPSLRFDGYDPQATVDKEASTMLGVHLRFGTVSIREVVLMAGAALLRELVWREFFMMILWHFPYVADGPFKKQFAAISWRNSEEEFERWCAGRTGFPLVDAGMRQLNATGFMPNRVRMVAASFLVKHLLVSWQWGEAYFASRLDDFELASNNGNWQWVAGTGCDAAPYFRIFNPETQLKKFDPQLVYCRRWIAELGTDRYPPQIVAHTLARERCLEAYAKAAKDQ